MRVEVDYEEDDVTCDGYCGIYDDDEDSYYETRRFSSRITMVRRHDFGEFEVEGDHDKVNVIYCLYSSGDSFGCRDGLMGIIEVLPLSEDAEAFCEALREHVKSRSMHSVEINGRYYSVPGASDYFGGVEDIDFEEWEVSCPK